MSQISFTVSAKTARLIGQENFANAEGAVIELVKNCYDADAKVCVVYIDTLHDYLYIIDNGDGMTRKIIEDKWMVIGTDDKEEQIKTKSNRVKTGAKGIGRFAMDRLGYKSTVITKIESTEREGCYWDIDWRQFEAKKKTISQVKATLEDVKPLDIKEEVGSILQFCILPPNFIEENWKDNKGTIIKINQLRDKWNGIRDDQTKEFHENSMVINLSSNLEDLIPATESDFFPIYLFHAEFPNKYGKVNADEIDDYDYKIEIKVADDQQVEIVIHQDEINLSAIKQLGFFENTELAKEPNYSLKSFEKGFITITTNVQKLLLDNKINFRSQEEKDKIIEQIGAFESELYYLKRGVNDEDREGEGKRYNFKQNNYQARRIWLDRFGGLKLYRDNFRVRPYGDPRSDAFDWIGLRPRSSRSSGIMKAPWKLSDKQIHGVIRISRLGNEGLNDKSNREGIKESPAFNTFKLLFIAIIEVFEQERTKLFRALYKLYDLNNPEQAAVKKANAVERKRKKMLNTEGVTKNTKTEDEEEDISGKNKRTEENQEEENSYSNTSEEDIDILIEGYEVLKDKTRDAEENQRILQALASAGLLVTSFAHDFGNLSGKLLSRTKRLKRSLDGLIDKKKLENLADYENPFVRIEEMRQEDEKLRKWLEFAVNSVNGTKRRKKDINLNIYLKNLGSTWEPLFNERQIQFINLTTDVFYLNCYEIDLDSIFTNLIGNSIEAFNRRDAGNRRLIRIDYGLLDDNTLFIDYEDIGPGLDESISDPYRIFDAYFSTKKHPVTGEQIGTGLGMWILKTAVENNKGSLQMLEFRKKFKLRMIFPKKNIDDV
jgi:signal transduction histidine kinase